MGKGEEENQNNEVEETVTEEVKAEETAIAEPVEEGPVVEKAKVEETKVEEPVDNSNNFEEVQVYQEVEPKKKVVRTDSYFDGGLLELIGWRILAFLIIGITFGIATPWAQCMLYSYQFKHTVYNGKRLKFEGTGGDLFVNMFKWIFFSIITLGIYIFFIPVRKAKWVVSNLHFEDEDCVRDESFFDGGTLALIGINILTKILNVVSFGLLIPFTTCFKLRWINKHVVINRKKLVFDGKAIGLFGKWILWTFLTLITFGIFAWWLPIVMLKWQTKNTRIKTVGEVEKKDRSLLIAVPILVLAIMIVVGLVSTFGTQIYNSTIGEIFDGNDITLNPSKSKKSKSNSKSDSKSATIAEVMTPENSSEEVVTREGYPTLEEISGTFETIYGRKYKFKAENGKLKFDNVLLTYIPSTGYASYVDADSTNTIEAYFTYQGSNEIMVTLMQYKQSNPDTTYQMVAYKTIK